MTKKEADPVRTQLIVGILGFVGVLLTVFVPIIRDNLKQSNQQPPVSVANSLPITFVWINVALTILVSLLWLIYFFRNKGDDQLWLRYSIASFVLLLASILFTDITPFSGMIINLAFPIISGLLLIYEFFTGTRKHIAKSIKLSYPKLSIIGIMRIRRANVTLASMFVIMISAVGYSIIGTLVGLLVNRSLTLFCLLLLALLAIEKLIFDYRIRKGLYGTNEREARTIIQFILQESRRIEFNDRGKPKKVISENDLEEIRENLRAKLFPSLSEKVLTDE